MTKYEQQAREMAERVAKAIAYVMREPAIPQTSFADDVETITNLLSELNLAKLLEDAAMLDWLEKKFPVPNEFKVAWVRVSLGKENNSVRTAIRNAMKEDGK